MRRDVRPFLCLQTQWVVPSIFDVSWHSLCGQLIVSYDKLWTLIMLGYRLAKSVTTTLMCIPVVGSPTSPPRYFFSFITAVVEAVPCASSSLLLGISSFLCLCS